MGLSCARQVNATIQDIGPCSQAWPDIYLRRLPATPPLPARLALRLRFSASAASCLERAAKMIRNPSSKSGCWSYRPPLTGKCAHFMPSHKENNLITGCASSTGSPRTYCSACRRRIIPPARAPRRPCASRGGSRSRGRYPQPSYPAAARGCAYGSPFRDPPRASGWPA